MRVVSCWTNIHSRALESSIHGYVSGALLGRACNVDILLLLLCLRICDDIMFANYNSVYWKNKHTNDRVLVTALTDTVAQNTFTSDRLLIIRSTARPYTHTHTRLTALCPGLPGWAGTREVKPIWILVKHETVSGSGISWAICISAPRSRQIIMPALHHLVFLQHISNKIEIVETQLITAYFKPTRISWL